MKVATTPYHSVDIEKEVGNTLKSRIAREQGPVIKRQASLADCMKYGIPFDKVGADFSAIDVDALYALASELKADNDSGVYRDMTWETHWSGALSCLLALKRGDKATDRAEDATKAEAVRHAARLLKQAMYLYVTLSARR